MTEHADERVIISAKDAEHLLADGPYIHNFLQSGFALVGCDYDRADAIAAFEDAEEIEIAGPAAKAMKHPIAVWEKGGRVTFFEADMTKVEAFEAALTAAKGTDNG